MQTPIRRSLIKMVLLTSGAALLIMSAGSLLYEVWTYRQSTIRNLATIGEMIATNSAAALAFDNPEDAHQVLVALAAERHIVAAGLYGSNGDLFAAYPAGLTPASLPRSPGAAGYRFDQGYVVGVQPVTHGERRLGTLYLKSDMGAMYERFGLFGVIFALVIALSCLAAYVISRILERQISGPILALSNVAQAVAKRHDYSVRAPRAHGLELGVLTDAFNDMLTRIAGQHDALAESELRLRAVLNSALSAVIVIDSDSRILDWNARAADMFGWSREQALGLELGNTIIPSRYREAHQRGLERFLATGAGPVLNQLLEMTAMRRDGSEFPVELAVNPLPGAGTVRFCGFITDITARKEAQSRAQIQLMRLDLLHRITRATGERQDLPSIFRVVLRNLEDNLPIDFGCMCLYDPTAEALTVATLGARSAAFCAALELEERTVLPIDQNGLARCVGGLLVYEPDTRAIPFPFPQRLAKAGLHAVVVAPLLVENRVFGVLVAARREAGAFLSADCEFLRHLSEHVALATHQAQLYGALQQAYDDLRQSQHTVMQQERLRALGQMASGIAHDINNAISPVALYTESLLEREPNLSDRARGYLVTIQRAIEDVAETVARMREFYRPREQQLQLTHVSLNRLIGQVVDLTRARWSDVPQQQGIVINLQTDLAPEVSDIMGAEVEIRDALTNLIFNAVDAMPEGGTLTLRTGATESVEGAPGDRSVVVPHAFVEVSDTGMGMDEETRRRCLEPFYTTKGERGTGLGLAMVYGMIQRHSAELLIESAPGKGTTVRLDFPIFEPAWTSTIRLPASSAPILRLHILLIDDDPLIIKSLQDILESDGHLVASADGGQAGIDAFVTASRGGNPFAVVITDLGMPYIDGRKVAAAIKAASPATPVILLTGWGKRMLAENDMPAHVNRILSKPPKLAELRLALAELAADSVATTSVAQA